MNGQLDSFLGLDGNKGPSKGMATRLMEALSPKQSQIVAGTEGFALDDIAKGEGRNSGASAISEMIRNAGKDIQIGCEGMDDDARRNVNLNMIKNATLGALLMGKDGQGARGALKALAVTAEFTPGNEESEYGVTFNKAANVTGPYGTIRTSGVEDYDNKQIQGMWLQTIGFNYGAPRQNAWAENLFPSIAVAPTKGGVSQEITFPTIFRDRSHRKDGGTFDLREHMILDALRDPDVMFNEATRINPAYDEDTKHLFVPESVLAPTVLENDRGVEYRTNYLLIDSQDDMNLLALAKRHFDTGTETQSFTAAIDPAMKLERILVKIGDQYVTFNVSSATQSKFQEKQTDHDRYTELSFRNESLMLSNKTKDVTGKPLALTQTLADDETIVLTVGVHGQVNCTYGNTQISASKPRINRYFSDSEDSISLKSGRGKEIFDKFKGSEIVGFKLDARLVNTDQAERGLLMETRTYRHRQVIPFKFPITHVAPVQDDDARTNAIIETLTMAAYVQNSNDAVTTFLNYAEVVKEQASRDKKGILKRGDIDGIMGHLFKPTYIEITVDLLKEIDSLRSMDRFTDVNSYLQNLIAATLYPARRTSNIDYAIQAQTNTQDEKPTWIINTDTNLVNYLMTQGDNRTLGADMEYVLNPTNNKYMDDKIIIVPSSKQRGEGSVTSFGTFYTLPTVVTKLPISRPTGGGTHSMEYRVTPMNLHVPNYPFMIVLNIKNAKEALCGSISTINKVVGGYDDKGTAQNGTGTANTNTTNTGAGAGTPNANNGG